MYFADFTDFTDFTICKVESKRISNSAALLLFTWFAYRAYFNVCTDLRDICATCPIHMCNMTHSHAPKKASKKIACFNLRWINFIESPREREREI